MRPVEFDSYIPSFRLNKPVDSIGIGKILKSNNASYTEDQLIIGELPIQQYVALDESSIQRICPLKNPLGIEDIRVFLSSLGMPGLTAYSAFYEIGKPRKGDTIFISAASGAVGQIVAQLAKREGFSVIGSIGSDEKLSYIIDELGFDGSFNYKQEKTKEALSRLAPQGLNIYFDNVGGEHLEAALDAMNVSGRLIACGMISDSRDALKPIKNIH